MANVIKLYRNGLTSGKSGINRNPPPRGKTTGWSSAVSRRMTKWLYSVNIDGLTGYGYSFTLTLKHCPETPEKWQALRDAFIMRLKRRGLVRLHWLTEWQRRGVPHLHGCAYFNSDEINPIQIKTHWLEVTSAYESAYKAQDCKIIDEAIGWYKYLSKHAVRGVQHYQRDSVNMPPAWQTSGRMWGRWGQWDDVVDAPVELTCDDETFYRFRRLVRNWRKAKARNAFAEMPSFLTAFTAKNPKIFSEYLTRKRNISRARRLLKCNSLVLSQVRGVNEFIPQDVGVDFVIVAKSHGWGVAEC